MGEFKFPNETYKIYSVPFDSDEGTILENISKIAVNYINSPYLWGGRSPYGVDCSGLVQVVFKSIGYKLPRDASQQVKEGTTVDFVNLTQAGDLAFFDNEDGNITHVGIVLPNGEIIHSSGFVRIDKLDQQGIFCVKTQTYSHKLRIIKRVL
jgi:cell wall-associated NlpC family hydrolase